MQPLIITGATMKDCDGQELNIGDRVATQRVGYKDLVVKKIITMTPKRLIVEDKSNFNNIRHIDPERVALVKDQQLKKRYLKVIKSIPEPCSAGCVDNIDHPCKKCGQQWGGNTGRPE